MNKLEVIACSIELIAVTMVCSAAVTSSLVLIAIGAIFASLGAGLLYLAYSK